MITIKTINNKDIILSDIVEDQQYLVNDIDLAVYIDGKCVGYFISQTPIFILVRGEKFTLDIAKAFLDYMSIDRAIIDHRDDQFPVRNDSILFEPIVKSDEIEALFEKRVKYEQSFGLSPSDISILYTAAAINQDSKAKEIVTWLRNIRNDYFSRIQNCNNAEYYDYDYSNNGDIPYSIEDVLDNLPTEPTPAEPISKIFMAVGHTWQNFKSEKRMFILWDEIKQTDPIYDLNKDTITVLHDGLIEVNYKLNFLNNEYSRVNVRCVIIIDEKEIRETTAYGYSRSKKYIQNTSVVCPSVIFTVKKGQKIRVKAEMAYNDQSFGDARNVTLLHGESVITLKTTKGTE